MSLLKRIERARPAAEGQAADAGAPPDTGAADRATTGHSARTHQPRPGERGSADEPPVPGRHAGP